MFPLLLVGCLYPDEQRKENQPPYEDQLQSVQHAVTQYREETSVLPIKTSEADTPILRKYPVNFSMIVPSYLQAAPGNSFENGGIYQYVIVDPEAAAEVRLIDLRNVKAIQELERKIYQYRSEHEFAPVDTVIGNELLKLDHEKLNYDEAPVVESPFHPSHRLPLYLQTDGTVVIDYSLDILYYVEEYGLGDFEEGDDLRWLLVEHSPFVPVNSIPQTIDNGEVIFLEE
ncbi:hypothetical protein MM221_19050 [Salipaludibacillus sp. LMS25]|jgi:hypothetical protein|uniref:hypothetical protein n=1 Tax=Salipaludibacillus sp. LMS25 TaxID=2924031 RepID=UPI0020CFFA75|nr:hypothetical protein [Salipaludibacillus sp. LMS25]UTR17085.1 hypothetical protein MM221_19050 [Salipaludibacillus sp. LMS25]